MSKLRRDFTKDVELVRNVSAKIDDRISREKISQDAINKLTEEELMDLNKLTNIANYILCKYEEKKEMKKILENIVGIIGNTCSTVDEVDDEIAELLISTENTVNKIKGIQSNMSNEVDMRQINNAKV